MSHSFATSTQVQNRSTLRNVEALTSKILLSQQSRLGAKETAGDLKDTLAANLPGALPKTPQRIAPNSARKRRPIPDLSRPSASPGHGEKMSMIFRDASATLQGTHTTPCRQSSSSKIPRLPPSQARSVRFGSVGQDDTEVTSYARTASRTHKVGVSPAQCRGYIDRQIQTPSRANNVDSVTDDSTSKSPCHLPDLLSHDNPNTVAHAADPLAGLCPGDEGREPISSGFATPSAMYRQPAETPEEIKYPEFAPWHLPRASPGAGSLPSSGSEELRCNSVGPLLPASPTDAQETDSTSITTWLHSIPNPSENIRPLPVQDHGPLMSRASTRRATPPQKTYRSKPRTQISQSTGSTPEDSQQMSSRAASNKENVSPSLSTPSPARSSIAHPISTLSRFRNPKFPAFSESSAALQFAHPLTPQGQLSLPPKRKKTRVGGQTKPDAPRSSKDFTIHDDQVVDALAQLSPDVELRRKGRRPKRERCISYWDNDILSPGSPCLPTDAETGSVPIRKGREVLGESRHTAALTKKIPFTAEAENAAFDFQA